MVWEWVWTSVWNYGGLGLGRVECAIVWIGGSVLYKGLQRLNFVLKLESLQVGSS